MLALGMTVGLALALAAHADGLPYDSRVEYLEAPVPVNNANVVSYIDTGLYPGDDRGVLLRVSPLREQTDTTVCGVLCGYNNKDFRWYMGFNRKTAGYLSWNEGGNPDDRFAYSPNKVYDISFNYLNDRNRRLVEVDGSYTYNLPITLQWPDAAATNTIYLFAYNNNGNKVGNTGNARIYSAKFTQGGDTVMDLVPVRKDGVGYFYDRKSGRLLGKAGTSNTPAFMYGSDIHAVSGSVKLDADADWSNDGTVWLDDDAVLDLNGHTLTVAKVAGTGKITDTSTGEPGKLSFTVADNAMKLDSVSVTGNLKVADVDATVSGNMRLNADVDWSGLGRVLFDTDAVIDLNGHTLTVADVFGNGTITDTSKGAPGTLCLNVGDGTNAVSTLALTGNLKVEKQGLGTLQLNRADQTFTGGVLVSGGTAKAVSGNNEANNYWGPANGEITVAEGATFDVMGNRGFYTKRLVLSGGTLDNNAAMTTSLTDGIGNVTLTENSSLMNKMYGVMIFLPADDGSRKVDLGGKTLTVDISWGGYLYLKIPVVNGTLDIVSGGYLYIPSGATGGSDSVDLRMVHAACYLIGDFEVRDYYAAYTGKYNHGGGRFLVHGTFTPVAAAGDKDLFHGCLMMDGSKIDLSSRTKPFNVVSQGYTGTGDMDGNRTMSFADGATVTILLGDRGASRASKIVDWSAAVPSNLDTLTFRGVYADGTTHTLEKKEDGLYNYVGLTITFY